MSLLTHPGVKWSSELREVALARKSESPVRIEEVIKTPFNQRLALFFLLLWVASPWGACAWAARARVLQSTPIFQRVEKTVTPVGTLTEQTQVEILRKSANGLWVEVQAGDQQGWVAAKNLEMAAEREESLEVPAAFQAPVRGRSGGFVLEPSLSASGDIGFGLGGGLLYRSIGQGASGFDLGIVAEFFGFVFSKPVEYLALIRYWLPLGGVFVAPELLISGRSATVVDPEVTTGTSASSVGPGFGLHLGFPLTPTLLLRLGGRDRFADGTSDLTFTAGLGFSL